MRAPTPGLAGAPAREGGFTLVELLVVVTILGILLAVAVPSYVAFRSRANNSAAQANVRAAVPSIEAYFAEHGTYAGMTLVALRMIDPAIAVELVGTPTASGYCIRSTEPPGAAYYKEGPDGAVTTTPC